MDPGTTHKSKVKPCTSARIWSNHSSLESIGDVRRKQALRDWQMTMTARALWIQLNQCACAVMWWHRTYASAEKSDSVTDASPDCLWRVIIKKCTIKCRDSVTVRAPQAKPPELNQTIIQLSLFICLCSFRFIFISSLDVMRRVISGAKRNFR